MTPRRSLRAACCTALWLAACDESNELLGTRLVTGADAGTSQQPGARPNDAAATQPRERDASSLALHDAGQSNATLDATATTNATNSERDSGRGALDAGLNAPHVDAAAPRDAGLDAAAQEAGSAVNLLGASDASASVSPLPLAPAPDYFRYPEGCEVTVDVPDPGWCSLTVECPEMALVTDCQTDDMSWDCATDFYFDELWSVGLADDYRKLRVPTELAPGDACSLATALTANHVDLSADSQPECSLQTGTNPSRTCSRAAGCWYTLPGSSLRVWENSAVGVYCSYLDAELWDDVEQSAWHCYFERPDATLDLYVLEDETSQDACDESLSLFSGWTPTSPTVCEPTSWFASEDDCYVELSCSTPASADDSSLAFGMLPYFECTRQGAEAVCKCGSGSVRQEVGSSASTDGWCAELSIACENGLEDGSIAF